MSKIARDISIVNSICKAYFDRHFDLQSVFRSSIRLAKRISIVNSFAKRISIVKSICKAYFDCQIDLQSVFRSS